MDFIVDPVSGLIAKLSIGSVASKLRSLWMEEKLES